MKKYTLGLDIGITSVGWGVIDAENDEIIKTGVRLFDEAVVKENTKRREFRGSRRLKRRRSFRLYRLKRLLEKEGFYSKPSTKLNPYEIRKKGLSEKLNNEELSCAILHIGKRRGSNFEVAEEEKGGKESSKKIILQNKKELKKGKYVCEIQLERFSNEKVIRDNKNIFKTEDYIEELKQILSNQNFKKDTKEKIISLIEDRRHFSEGPGSINSPSEYGRYILNERGEIEKIDLIEKMRGKCSVFENEPRAPKNSYTTDLYNLYNDLNNLRLENRKITKNEKEKIIDKHINKKGKISFKQIAKICNVDESKISGYRITKNGNPTITEFNGFNEIRKVVEKKENNLSDEIMKNKKKVDNICDVLTATKNIDGEDGRIKRLKKIDDIIDEEAAINLANINKINGYGALSYKALELFINEMKDSNLNQMQVKQKLNLISKKKEVLKGSKKIKFDDSEILSPVVKRAQREAIKVVNALRNEFGEFESVVIEMVREKNSLEQKKKIDESQKRNENERKKVEELLNDKGFGKRINSKLLSKIKLYKEQEGKCALSLEPIDLERLIKGEDNFYEIDHILPISQSFDDSFSNKILVKKSENQDKGQRTPFHYFSSGRAKISFDKFKTFVNKTYKEKFQNKKQEYLLFKGDLEDPERQIEFLNRNLVDTAYATRSLMSLLKQYYSSNNVDTKVFSIRGSVVGAFRRRAKLYKNRDLFKHHAEDALIIARLRHNNHFRNSLLKAEESIELVDEYTGEVIEKKKEQSVFDDKSIKFISSIRDYEDFKFSHKVDTKANRSISDQTIYSTKEIDGNVKVIKKPKKDIYDNKVGKKMAQFIMDPEKRENLLVYKNDKKTFEKLFKICQEYNEAQNPFIAYKNEHGYVRKYAKDEKGPIIRYLRYVEDKLGNHIDISHKYNLSKKDKKIVLLQVRPYRMDLYFDGKNYKFITIRFSDLSSKNKNYYIDKDLYKKKKEDKKITEKHKFLYSFYRNNIIKIIEDKEPKFYRFLAVNDDERSKVELKVIDKFIYNEKKVKDSDGNEKIKKANTQKQLTKTIGRKTEGLEKYHVDVLGNYYKSEKENLQLDL